MIAALENNDVVIGSRYAPGGGVVGWSWFRRFLSVFGGRVVTRLFTGLRPADSTSGFRAYRAEILRKIDLEHSRSEGYGFLVEVLFRCQRAGARIAEVPITYVDRQAGRSKLSKRIILESALLCFRLGAERVFRPRRWSG
jgi:dolichol-phosphate mannosyltransferase